MLITAKSRIFQITVFFAAAAFLISWLGWIPILLNSYGCFSINPLLLKALLVFPAASPALAAVVSRRVFEQKQTEPDLLKGFLQYRVALFWYLAAILTPAVLLFLTLIAENFIFPLITVTSLSPPLPPSPPQLPQGTISEVLEIFALSVLANPWEEIGWRGFLLPRLQKAYSPLTASLLIGALSAGWHLPLFFWKENAMSAYPFFAWATGTICTAIIATWLFNNTGGSLLITTIFHISLNVASVALGIKSFYIYSAVSLIFVIILIAFSNLLSRSSEEICQDSQ